MLSDAEEKQVWNPGLTEWLDELREATFEAENLVDEINTEALRCKLEGDHGSSSSHQVLNLISTTFSAFSKHVEKQTD